MADAVFAIADSEAALRSRLDDVHAALLVLGLELSDGPLELLRNKHSPVAVLAPDRAAACRGQRA